MIIGEPIKLLQQSLADPGGNLAMPPKPAMAPHPVRQSGHKP